jgi:hypothetical protein
MVALAGPRISQKYAGSKPNPMSYSNSATITVSAKSSQPVITGTRVISSTSLELTWTAPSDNGGVALTGYAVVYRSAAFTTITNSFSQKQVSASPTYTTIDKLIKNDTYIFWVVPYTNQPGNFSEPWVEKFVIEPPPPKDVKFSMYKNGYGEIQWTPSDVSEDESPVLFYTVTLTNDTDTTKTDSVDITPDETNSNLKTWCTLSVTANYTITITASNTYGEGVASDPLHITASKPYYVQYVI